MKLALQWLFSSSLSQVDFLISISNNCLATASAGVGAGMKGAEKFGGTKPVFLSLEAF